MPRSAVATRWLTNAFLALALWRLGALFAAEPMLGVANNYDMIRVQACIDVYPLRDDSIHPASFSPDQPLERYRFTPNIGAPCFLTSEVLFAALAWPAMQAEAALSTDGGFSLRWIGGAKLLLLCALVAWVHRRLRARHAAGLALAHAALVALVVADPAVGLYLNTFYAEFSAVFFAYALLVLLWLGMQPGRSGWGLHVGLLLAAIGLATSKVQHVLTPAFVLGVILLLCGLRVLRIERRLVLALMVGALLGAVIQAVHLRAGQTDSMARANIVNTIFYGLLPQTDDPARFVQDLGLPNECAELVGDSWFTPGMMQGELCPHAQELSRVDLVRALAHQPVVVPRLMFEMVMHQRPWVPQFLGLVAGRSMGRLGAPHFSLDTLLSALPGWAYFGLIAGLPLAAWASLRMRNTPEQHAANAVLAILSTYPWFGLAVVAFGDGGIDASKQSHLATTAVIGACVVLLALMLSRVRGCDPTQ